jgi:two-component system, sensor histidine kinase PdtaS
MSGQVTANRESDRAYLQRLIASWGMVADFCFGDLLLFVPVENHENDDVPAMPTAFTVVAQIRPTTSQTLYQDDLVGRVVTGAERPLLIDCWQRCETTNGQNVVVGGALPARVDYVPVVRRFGDQAHTVAILTRESALDVARRPGRLERVYVEIFVKIAGMISTGLFPYQRDPLLDDDPQLTDAPRVGDGVIVVDGDRSISYASPNAISALHRLGMFANAEGRTLATLGVGLGAAEACFSTKSPVLAEVERVNPQTEARMIVAIHSLPLLDGEPARETAPGEATVSGAIVLLRDISDLRRRDRLLMTKDATIREVHHRVKNNLQTISALLRLQGRRTTSSEARAAIEESVRRIRAIALVHETLSRDVRESVPFDEIVRPLVRMVEESIVSPDQPIRIAVDGSLGDLPAEIATPLAVVLTELIQNAVEHGFGTTFGAADLSRSATVDVMLRNEQNELVVEVRDNGVGLPDGFSLSTSKSLGLSIVRTLVTSELGGAISFRSDSGTIAQLRIPRAGDARYPR